MAMQTNQVPLTRAAYEEMTRELEYLRTTRRREVAEDMRQAWESELDKDFDVTTPYNYAREEQSFLEGRIATLEDMLANAMIIDEEAARASDTVQLGSVVVLVNGDNIEHEYQIVGPAESDPAAGKLSQQSPVGAAVMGRRAGDTVEVQTPSGMKTMRIVELR